MGWASLSIRWLIGNLFFLRFFRRIERLTTDGTALFCIAEAVPAALEDGFLLGQGVPSTDKSVEPCTCCFRTNQVLSSVH